MILWSAAELQTLLNLPSLPPRDVTGVTFDSRQVQAQDLFIALRGPIKDGHDFVDQALAKGAALALVDHPHGDPRTLLVDDTFEALKILAIAARVRSQGQILAVTGSFGKTTAKECLAYHLKKRGPTTATERSFNNHWGVPLSVARLFATDAFGVFEIGMNHQGEIAELTHLVRPHVALITTVAGAHQGNFAALEDIALAKSEIFLSMAPGSKAVLPLDNPYFYVLQAQAKAQDLEIITFGRHPQAHVRLESFTSHAKGLTVHFTAKGLRYAYDLNAYGEHLAETTLGVMAVFSCLDEDLTDICTQMAGFNLLPGRGHSQLLPWGSGQILVVDESYNAGPDSMTQTLLAFGHIPLAPDARRWVVLGDMLELGALTRPAHEALKDPIQKAFITGAFLMGPAMKYLHQALPLTQQGGHFEDLDTLGNQLIHTLKPGDAVFIKGSRGQRDFAGHMAKVLKILESHSAELAPSFEKERIKGA